MRLSDVIQENLRVPNQDQCIPERGGAGGVPAPAARMGHTSVPCAAPSASRSSSSDPSRVLPIAATPTRMLRRRPHVERRTAARFSFSGVVPGRAHDQPRIIFTALAKDELTGPRGEGYRRMIELSPVGRGGTPDDVGAVGALLMGPEGTVITGSDFLMDGGVTAPTFTANLPHADRHRALQDANRRRNVTGLPHRPTATSPWPPPAPAPSDMRTFIG